MTDLTNSPSIWPPLFEVVKVGVGPILVTPEEMRATIKEARTLALKEAEEIAERVQLSFGDADEGYAVAEGIAARIRSLNGGE